MAKLIAHGQELARVSRETTICGEHYTDKTYDFGTFPIHCGLATGHPGVHAEDATSSWRRQERALMADGVILEKYTYRLRGATRPESPGWKILNRTGRRGQDMRDVFLSTYKSWGWTEVS